MPREATAGVTVLPVDCSGLAATRYDARPGTTYLIRPDRYVAARWRCHDPDAVQAASPGQRADRRRQWKARCDARSTSRSPTTSTMPLSMRTKGSSDEECRAFDARLILLLVNRIGDETVIHEALKGAAP